MKLSWSGVVLAVGLSLGANASSAEPFKLIVTHLEPPLVPNSVMDLAQELGYFERAGVDVEFVRVQQTPSAIAALQAGEGDMANISTSAQLSLVARGVDDLVAVASPNKFLPFLIASRTEFAKVEDLDGARFGVGRLGSLDHSLSSVVLDAEGLSLDETELVALGQPGVRAQALAAGQIDATTMSIGVWLSLPDRSGLHVLVEPETYYKTAPLVTKVNVVPRDVLEQRGNDVEKVLSVLTQASRDFASTPSIWVDAMVKARPDVERETLEDLAQAYITSWSVNGGLQASEMEYTTNWLFEGSDFEGATAPALEDWISFAPMDKVLDALGEDARMDTVSR
ncbi:ABC transporter substrate-binding protein [Celeribacter sp.]|uniref:ABC transporter substrate-binding protein n=1 Tax=Celeribacter sp. TaxID=1890673 RepID=UPI003A95C425